MLSCPSKKGVWGEKQMSKVFLKVKLEKKGSKTHLLIYGFSPHIMKKQDRTNNGKKYCYLFRNYLLKEN